MADESQKLLEDGLRHERGGSLALALRAYQKAARCASEPQLLAEAYRRLADVYRIQCNWGDATQAARRSAEIAESAGLAVHAAEALNAEALVHQSRGSVLPAIALYERILDLTSDDRLRGIAHQNLGTIAAGQKDFAAAERHLLDSYQHFQKAAYLRGVAIALINYAAVALDQGKVTSALEFGERALDAARGVEDLELIALAMLNGSEARASLGQLARAEELAIAALGYFSLMENTWRRVECLRILGDLRREQGSVTTARQCYLQALSLAETLESPPEVAQLQHRLQHLEPPTRREDS